MERIRSFISIDVEDEGVLRGLTGVQSALVKTGADLKLVKPENIHLTLRFLGEIPVVLVDEIFKVMQSAVRPPFEMEVKGLGAFPSVTRPRVIWAGVSDGAEAVVEIHRKIEAGLKRLGFRPEDKRFTAHITIARVKSRRNVERLLRVFQEYRNAVFGRMLVDCIRLKKSVLTPRGPIYTTLREVQLA